MTENKSTIEWVEKCAKDVMETKGSHSPQFIIIYPETNEVELYLLLFKDDDEKIRMMKSIRNLIRMKNVNEYFFVMEGWKTELPQDSTKPYIRPSKHPDRKECLVINHYRKDMKNTTIMLDFKREDEKIIWTDRIENRYDNKEMEYHSRWNFFVEDYQEGDAI